MSDFEYYLYFQTEKKVTLVKEHISAKINDETIIRGSFIGYDTKHALVQCIWNVHDISYGSHIILELSDYSDRQLGSAAMLGPAHTTLSAENYYWMVEPVLTVYEASDLFWYN